MPATQLAAATSFTCANYSQPQCYLGNCRAALGGVRQADDNAVMSATVLDDPARIAALLATGLLDSPEDPAMRRLARLATQILGVPMAMVSLVDRHRQVFHGATSTDAETETGWAIRETPLSHSLCQATVQTRADVVIPDTFIDSRYSEAPSVVELRISAYCGVPLTLSNGLVLGVFCAIDHETRLWEDKDIQVLHDLAAWAVVELELRIALHENERRRSLLDAVVSSVPDAVIAVDQRDGRLLLCNQAATHMIARYKVTPKDISWIAVRTALGLQDEVGRLLAPQDDPLVRGLVGDGHSIQQLWLAAQTDDADGVALRRCVTITTVPIPEVGVLLTFRDITESKHKTEHLQKLAYGDGLTKLLNRRGFFELAESALQATRDNAGSTTFFIDLDNMKRVNDQLGHAQGDRALQLVATTLRECFRESDLIGRIGGDEFAVFAASVNEATAERLTERIHTTLRRASIEADVGLPVTVTIGTSTLHSPSQRSLQQLLVDADAHMYTRKKSNSPGPQLRTT